MKRALVLVVALLAVSCLLAAAAYTSATVTNYSQIAINNTNASILELDEQLSLVTGFKDATAYNDQAMLKFRFGWNNGTQHGLQRDSVYTWWDNSNKVGLFAVKNNSADKVRLTFTENYSDDQVTFEFLQYLPAWPNGTAAQRNTTSDSGWQDAGYNSYEPLYPGETARIGVRITSSDTASVSGPLDFDINVSATPVL
ncbi:MAG: hypothetical protein H0Z39_03350 [Peptococcaceae bacterium]|nr:hypothetical protein [Peptococcaceae bacterium]